MLGMLPLHGYEFNGWAIPPAVVAALLAREGIKSLRRRSVTDEAIYGGCYLLAGSVWLAATTVLLLSTTDATAMFWARGAIVGLAMMPVFGAGYSRILLTRGPSRRLLALIWVVTMWIIAEALYSNTVITSVQRYWWGYHPRYGWVGTVMLVFNTAVSSIASNGLMRDIRQSVPESRRRRRNITFFVGLTIGTTAYVDFFACYGIPVYPFGYASLLGMLLILSAAIRRYGLLDLTLAGVADEVLRAAEDGVVAIDPDGWILRSNPAALALLSASTLEGRTVDCLGEVVTPTEHQRLLGADTETWEATIGERVIEVRNNAIVGHEGRPAGTLYLLRDVTAERAMMRELREAKEIAEDAAQQKSRFLTTMSHEIRTPLTGVIGTTELLMQTELDPTQHEYARVARASGRHLLGVINDILDYSRLESDGVTIRDEDFELGEVLRDTLDIVGHAAADKGLELTHRLAPQLPRWVRGDARALEQVLVNLVGNAIKFTPKGRVSVEVDRTEDGVEFTVRDTGIGIPEEQLERLFESFSQVDGSMTRDHGGSGLGLAISQRLCGLMGGRIVVDSVEGEGSTFSFVLALPAGSEPVRSRATASEHSLDGLRVLLADDNGINQKIGRAMLRRLGLEVEMVDNGAEALEAVRDGHFDLVLMDCEMPVMDGYTAAARIREQEDGQERRLPIVAMTAHALHGERERCLEAGMDDFVTKPVTGDRLETVIRAWTAR